MDIICLTSLNEGTPVSLIEAQAAGKPIVATSVGGVEDVVMKNKTAFLTTPEDLSGFTDYLLHLINSRSKREEMSSSGREFVLERFGYKRLVQDMSSLYYRLLQNKKFNGRHV
ncbi:MAG: glycosyltransferase [Bacteroidia bacterium]|nr:glycosyltransferase [Bacteroidia bacterium]